MSPGIRSTTRWASWSSTQPMPSMPIYFWGDPDGERYRDSYFSMFPGVWRHGDWIEITAEGERSSTGRSDSTINRGGVRRARARSTAPCWPSMSWSTRWSSTVHARARTAGCRCSWCCATRAALDEEAQRPDPVQAAR